MPTVLAPGGATRKRRQSLSHGPGMTQSLEGGGWKEEGMEAAATVERLTSGSPGALVPAPTWVYRRRA